MNQQENGSCYELVSITIRGLAGLSRRIVYMGLYHCRVSHRLFLQAYQSQITGHHDGVCGGRYDCDFFLIALATLD